VVTAATLALAGSAATGPATSVASGASSKTYIVQLKAPPVASYTGGTAAGPTTTPIPATSPKRTGGARVNARSGAAMRYRSYLAGRQRAALARAGGATPTVQYSYRVAFSGFTARLTRTQVARLRDAPEVAKVWENRKQKPQALDPADEVAVDGVLGGPTGDGASYLGLPQGLWKTLGGADHAGEGVIVGVIDSGIQPGHPSFADDPSAGYVGTAYSAPPVWNGTCQTGERFAATDCNHKLIGARYFVDGFDVSHLGAGSFLSPRDDDGHGSHTAATAAGNFGVDPSIGGNDLGVGLISGIAPRAYVAAYKVCWIGGDVASGCSEADSVAAIDAAVRDGVDVINYSIASPSPTVFGPTERAFLGAADAGVFVATAAGNDGPGARTVGSPGAAPWLTTVGASTLARTFSAIASVTGAAGPDPAFTLTGASVSAAPLAATDVIDGAAAGTTAAPVQDAALCRPGALDPGAVAGKVVICRRGDNARVDKGRSVLDAGGVGMVLYNASDAEDLVTDTHVLPTVHVSFADGRRLIGALQAGTQVAVSAGTRAAATPRVMAAFSSRGPQTAASGIPKPDVTAPGVNILAAAADEPAGNAGLKAGELFQAISGTSMASPHVAGAGALLTQAHPTWSAAAIKSALMTTADPDVLTENGIDAADPFDAGSGQIDPTKAAAPGLVLDAGNGDYRAYLRGIDPALVPDGGPQLKATDLNLPAISSAEVAGTLTTTRTFTSVDGVATEWVASVTGLPGFATTVTPSTFQVKPGQPVSVQFSATRTTAPLDTYAFGALELTAGARHVRLPLSLRPTAIVAPATIALRTDQPAGTRAVPVTPGFSGSLSALGWGLTAPTVKAAQTVTRTSGSPVLTAPDAGTKPSAIDVPAGAQLLAARLANVDGGDPGTDLDLFLYRDPNGDGDLGDAVLVDESAGASSAERVSARLPAAGRYVMAVVGSTTRSPSSTFDLDSWVVDDAAPDVLSGTSAGITVTGDPLSVLSGEPVTPSLAWDAVASKGLYLGVVTYHDSATPTPANVIGSSVVELDRTTDPSHGSTTPTPPTPPATPPGPKPPVAPVKPGPVTLTVAASGARVLSRGRLRLQLKLSRRASVRIVVRRGSRAVASTRRVTVLSGRRTVTLKLSRTLRRGSYRVRATATVGTRTAGASAPLRVR
jgi:subtilisin family serine protease